MHYKTKFLGICLGAYAHGSCYFRVDFYKIGFHLKYGYNVSIDGLWMRIISKKIMKTPKVFLGGLQGIFSSFQHIINVLWLLHTCHVFPFLNTPTSCSADGKSGSIAKALPEMRSRFHAEARAYFSDVPSISCPSLWSFTRNFMSLLLLRPGKPWLARIWTLIPASNRQKTKQKSVR